MVVKLGEMARMNLALGFTDLKTVFNDIATGYTPTNPQDGTFRDFSKLENLDTPTPLDNCENDAFFVYPPNILTTDCQEIRAPTGHCQPLKNCRSDSQNEDLSTLPHEHKPNVHQLTVPVNSNPAPMIPMCISAEVTPITYHRTNFQPSNLAVNTLSNGKPLCQMACTESTPIQTDQISFVGITAPMYGPNSIDKADRTAFNKSISGAKHNQRSYSTVSQNSPQQVCNVKPVRPAQTLEKAFACPAPNCVKRFARVDELKRHQRTHSDVKQFICDLCTKGFTRSDHLMTHRRTHTGERPYPCKLCDRRFARSDERNRHTKVHFREKSRSGRKARPVVKSECDADVVADTHWISDGQVYKT